LRYGTEPREHVVKPGKGEPSAMIKVKSFTAQLKIFHARHELDELDKEVSDFIASQGIRKVISLSDASTTGDTGETIGLIRVLTYEEHVAGSKEHYQEKIESTLNEWGGEIEKIRKKADQLGADAKDKYREQIEDLRARQETARKKLEDLKRTGGEAWEDLRHGAEAALDELKKGVEGAVAKLKKE
jgi:Skp family chaperone for outer membrane proteins